MPQESVNYAAGRISMLRRDALDMVRLERLLTATSFQEARRTLSEIGWTGSETADPEQLALMRVESAGAIVRSLTTDTTVTDCFLLKYDIANLKMLLKARCLSMSAEYLSHCGIFPVDTLCHGVADHEYGFLPPEIAQAMNALENELVVDVNPLRIDVKLDQAMYTLITKNLEKSRCQAAKDYFRKRADILNAIMLLRVKKMRKGKDLFLQALLPGGEIAHDRWDRAFENPEALPEILSSCGEKVKEALQNAVLDFTRLPALEKAMENELLHLFTPYKYEIAQENVIGYFLAVEREAAAVRLIMAGKQGNFPEEALRERLRDLYV